jgi:hypothetical protein
MMVPRSSRSSSGTVTAIMPAAALVPASRARLTAMATVRKM